MGEFCIGPRIGPSVGKCRWKRHDLAQEQRKHDHQREHQPDRRALGREAQHRRRAFARVRHRVARQPQQAAEREYIRHGVASASGLVSASLRQMPQIDRNAKSRPAPTAFEPVPAQ
jgi:hypothetical protein